MMHEEVDKPEVSKTDSGFEAQNKSTFFKEIPLLLDCSKFMFSLYFLI